MLFYAIKDREDIAGLKEEITLVRANQLTNRSVSWKNFILYFNNDCIIYNIISRLYPGKI